MRERERERERESCFCNVVHFCIYLSALSEQYSWPNVNQFLIVNLNSRINAGSHKCITDSYKIHKDEILLFTLTTLTPIITNKLDLNSVNIF